MKFLAQQLIGATVVMWGAFVAGAAWPCALGCGIAATGLSILLERVR